MISSARKDPFRLTLIHPCVGRLPGRPYVRTWQMEPLPPAALAALTPKDVDIRFYDDRNELIPFDEPTDLVGISLETYTARRAYQIASEFRRRGIPVVTGGFHAGLCPEEASRYSESVVVGEAENLWPQVIDDYRHGTPKKLYRQAGRPELAGTAPDRSIFSGKRYLPVRLLETARGCNFVCDFCAVQTYFQRSQTFRPIDEIVEEAKALKRSGKIFFLVDDNLGSFPDRSIELFKALAPLGLRWVSQCSINVAHDDDFLHWMKRSGCLGVLIGFESLRREGLTAVNKDLNRVKGGYDAAVTNIRKHGLQVYGTFIFGHDSDRLDDCRETVEFARRHQFFLAAFNHLIPFPGTPLYQRLEKEGRLTHPAWWMDAGYRYNEVPFTPKWVTPGEVRDACLKARADFYSLASIARRSASRLRQPFHSAWGSFLIYNLLHRREVQQRDGLCLGDPAYQGALLRADS